LGGVKAQRATIELGLLGSCYLVTGLAAVAEAAGRGKPELGALAAVIGVLVLGGAIWVIGMAVHGLREMQGLPETAKRVSWLSVAGRVLLSCALPVATVVMLSMMSVSASWILGLTCTVLGSAICATAALASHVESLCGARVWRSSNRFYFAR